MSSSDLSIGLTGLLTAQSALKTIGHNISNVNTPGYSRQSLSLESRKPDDSPYGPIGAGVSIKEIVRIKDDLLNSQINSFKSMYGSAEVQSDMLQNIESIFNELSEFSLNSMLEKFFESVQNLSLNPVDTSARDQLLQDAQNLATQGFRSLHEQFRNLTLDASKRIEASVSDLNSITSEIASLNKRINEIELGTSGENANDLMDKRDILINELSELSDIRVITNSRNSSVDILLGGTLVVHAENHEEITTAIVGDGIARIQGLSTAGINGGKLEGLLNMQDVTIPKYTQFIDTLAASFIKEVNNIHSEGMGLGGGFTTLTSTNAVNDADDLLTDTGLSFIPDAGDLYITVTNDSTGSITKNTISIASNETLNTLTAKITALSDVTASNTNGILTISANSGYSFNFSKELDPNPGNIGSAPTTFSGYYTGDDNDTFTLTVVDAGVDGEIGKGTAKIEVTDSSGTVISTLDVGSSYVLGNQLSIADGVSVSFGGGNIALTQNVTLDVVSDPDTSNVLTSLGLNTFFEGDDASTIGVSQYIANDISKIAAASSTSPGDNTNALRLIDLQHSSLTSGATFSDFLHGSVAQLGIETKAQNSSKESFQTILTNLGNRRQEVSGVSIDEEMVNTLRFQQAFQASARFISAITETSKILMEM